MSMTHEDTVREDGERELAYGRGAHQCAALILEEMTRNGRGLIWLAHMVETLRIERSNCSTPYTFSLERARDAANERRLG